MARAPTLAIDARNVQTLDACARRTATNCDLGGSLIRVALRASVIGQRTNFAASGLSRLFGRVNRLRSRPCARQRGGLPIPKTTAPIRFPRIR